MDFDAKQFPEAFFQRCSEETLCSYSSYGYMSRVFPLLQVSDLPNLFDQTK